MKCYNYTGIDFGVGLILIALFAATNGTGLTDDNSSSMQLLELDQDYHIYRKKFMWADALNFCDKCAGDFATFDTPAEAARVAELIYEKSYFTIAYDHGKEKHEFGLNRRYWISLTDEMNEGEWVWKKSTRDNGTVLANHKSYHWYPGQPDHVKSKTPEHCVGYWNPVYHKDEQKSGINATGRKEFHSFNDMPCDQKLYFICKKGTPSDSSDPICSDAPKTSTVITTTSTPQLITTTESPSISTTSMGTTTPVPTVATTTMETTTATPSTAETTSTATTTAIPNTSTEKPAHELGDPYTEAELLESQAIAVHWHNIFRAWHNAPNISIDAELNKKAQLAAENLVRLGRMEHTSTGENLYLAAHSAGKRRTIKPKHFMCLGLVMCIGRLTDMNCFQAVKNAEFAVVEWYFELCDTENWPKGELNHFTQVIWNDSVKLGIGVATNKENSQIHVVARYDPVGNYEGEYDLGVAPIRCGVETVCDGLKPKNVTKVEDCPATLKPAAAGRSMRKRPKDNHRRGNYIHPKERPIKILDRK